MLAQRLLAHIATGRECGGGITPSGSAPKSSATEFWSTTEASAVMSGSVYGPSPVACVRQYEAGRGQLGSDRADRLRRERALEPRGEHPRTRSARQRRPAIALATPGSGATTSAIQTRTCLPARRKRGAVLARKQRCPRGRIQPAGARKRIATVLVTRHLSERVHEIRAVGRQRRTELLYVSVKDCGSVPLMYERNAYRPGVAPPGAAGELDRITAPIAGGAAP
mgnify:CR=1 FL=1